MKKKLIITSIIGIVFVSVLSIIVLCKKTNSPIKKSYVEKVDYATMLVLENQLMQVNPMITYNVNDFEIVGCYFDGVRLYLNVKSSFDFKDNFSIKTNKHIYDTSVFLTKFETRLITDDSCVLVFNSIENANLSDLRLHYEKQEICTFKLSDNFANKFVSEAYFEEMQLNWIQFGKTSTLINCKIAANIQGKSFIVEHKDIRISVYVVDRSKDDYTFLIPFKLDEKSNFNFISQNEQSVELRIPINLDLADLKV